MKECMDSQEHVPGKKCVTLALFTYNQREYIADAVLSALGQQCDPIEIILSDDCSKDGTFEVMKGIVESYKGPHHVVLRQSKINSGLASHVNEVLSMVTGEIVVFAAGDDVSHPERVQKTQQYFSRHQDVVEVLVSADVIDKSGKVVSEKRLADHAYKFQSQENLFAGMQQTFGAGRAIRREVFSRFGALNENCPTEDTPLMLRALLLGKSLLVSDKLVQYRVHGSNLSSVESISKMDVKPIYDQYVVDLAKAFQLNLIDEIQLSLFANWIRNNKRVRRVRSLLNQGVKLDFESLVSAMNDRGLLFKSKLKAVALFLFGKR